MKYKDQYGTIEYWKDSNVWAGKLIGISDLVTYEADTYGDLWSEFVAAVDDYLETCKNIGRDPEMPETEDESNAH